MIPIHFEDEHYIIVEKPSGLLVHPYWAQTNERDNLMARIKEQTGHYLYPFQRLDRPVSGPVIFGLTVEATKAIQATWHSDQTLKRYQLLAARHLDPTEGVLDFPLKNEQGVPQEARTEYKTIEQIGGYSYCDAIIKTGRNHQIRRHFSRSFRWIVGDTKHGRGAVNRLFREHCNLHRIFLHAHQVRFNHPYSNQTIEIYSPLPKELQNTLNYLRLNPLESC